MTYVIGNAKPPLSTFVCSTIGALALILVACASPSPTTGAGSGEKTAPAGPKTLTLAMQSEPTELVAFGRVSPSAPTPSLERYHLFHAALTSFDFEDNPTAWVAQKVPSIEDGDWKVFPDGTMEVTWKLRPDVYWHDGVPMTSQDLVFGWQVANDAKLVVPALGELSGVAGVKAPDERTFVVSWKRPSVYGNSNDGNAGIPAIPMHTLKKLYEESDVDGFTGSPAWRGEFLGLGPYRVTNWEPGSHVNGEAFDQYFLGRPKIDRIVVKWIVDVNVILANLLAGAIDVAPAGSQMKPEQMVQLGQKWGKEGGNIFRSPTNHRVLWINMRDATPGAPWVSQDPRFRQAMFYSLDRQKLVDTIQYGVTTVSDYFLFDTDPVYKLAKQMGVRTYPYDPAQGVRLFAEVGWTKAVDGLLHDQTGQVVPPFVCCRNASADSNDNRENLAFGAELQTMGLDFKTPIPETPAGMNSTDARKFQVFARSGNVNNWFPYTRSKFQTLITSEIANDNNRWQGQNSPGWENAQYEMLNAKALSTFNVNERRAIQVEQLRVILENLPGLPAYDNPNLAAARKGVTGPGPAQVLVGASSWNIQTWDIS